eukprot:TRINITY_DN24123_c0_g1_i1.p1 TRINITY_DN24123_c0_g1~~TRINITY_DN24123_c0_g1_i1.p1  ORF type:complete len:623 (-),score=79.12 TRINITY_DN24123_c0_g1_i1:87-1907(-)
MSTAAATASSTAVRRLRRDLEALQRAQNPQITVKPSDDNLLEWHFVFHSLPSDTPYHRGCYHGKVMFAPEHPHKPPAIVMITPSGRLETGRKLCLSMTDFHPESWNPAWSVETILVGLLSFFIENRETGYGAVDASEAQRRKMAEESWAANAAQAEFVSLFPEFVHEPRSAAAEDVAQAVDMAQVQPAEDLEAAPRGDQEEEAPMEEPMECWICRDTSSAEPLIQPCACRGSMSGVHASCVEEWIRHHRRNAMNDAPPRCSVCNQQYQGSERRPGVTDFLRDKCAEAGMQLIRTLVLVGVLMGYQAAALSKEASLKALGFQIPMYARVILLVGFAAVALHKIVVLMVSLPPHRLPPQNLTLQRVFVGDFKLLAMHIAEAFAACIVLTFWWLTGELSLSYFIPCLIAFIVLLGKLCLRSPSLACLRRAGLVALGVVLFPITLFGLLITVAINQPRMVFHPLGAGPHLALAVAVVPMALLCESNLPLLILWGVHSAFILAGLVERLTVRRLRWQEGVLWWFLIQLSLIAVYTCNICEFPAGIGDKDSSVFIVAGGSFTWFLLVLLLSLSVNWALCVRYYRTWQHQRGTFSLQVTQSTPSTHGQDLPSP